MQMIRITSSVVIAAALCAAGAVSAQEYRGTYEQQMACTPDVFRLCSSQMPDAGRIVACLRQNTSQLSGACRAVFETNASDTTGVQNVERRSREVARAPRPAERQAPDAYEQRPAPGAYDRGGYDRGGYDRYRDRYNPADSDD